MKRGRMYTPSCSLAHARGAPPDLQSFRDAFAYSGSRARGTARPDSDWDIAIVVDDPAIDHVIHSKHTPPPAPFEGYTNLDILTLTPTIIAQDRCAFGRIAQQIAEDGQPLIGDWIMTPNDPPAPAIIDLNRWGSGMTTSLNHMTIALNEIDAYKRRTSYN